jgi:DNA-binding phage protein
MTEDNPISYQGAATLPQFLAALRGDAKLRRSTAAVARGFISKSSLYDVLKDHERVSVSVLLRFCKSYDVDLVVAVRKKT